MIRGKKRSESSFPLRFFSHELKRKKYIMI